MIRAQAEKLWGIRGPSDEEAWKQPSVTPKILADDPKTKGLPIPMDWTRTCAKRVQTMRAELKSRFVGLELEEERGHLLDWALACLIARENLLLLGPPGVAKTEIAESIFRLQGLETPKAGELPALRLKDDDGDYAKWWTERENVERNKHKYFRYLLSRFTQPEELFGPIEIDLLRRGMLVHVNFGLLTSPGVRGAFLDEIFKASSSILNSLLTLVLEREYFNWGGMRRSDLVMFIGASNELPGGLATGTTGVGAGGEDFNLLYAFLDRFPLRLEIPNVSGASTNGKETRLARESDLFKASEKALNRERLRFMTADAFEKTQPASVNDVLLLGRAILHSAFPEKAGAAEPMFQKTYLEKFTNEFYEIAASLQNGGTGLRASQVSWTISPRKLKALYKIALAHALVADGGFAEKDASIVDGPRSRELHVFDFIWDTPLQRDELRDRVRGMIGTKTW